MSKRPLQILLAEDAPANQTLVVRLLEKRGHRVTVANNGREAVELFEQSPFDLILMDLQMPEMDGLAATSAIRTHLGDRRPVPIVALSVHNTREDRERCLLAGMDACIAKPIDVAQLMELVETLTLRGQSRTTTAPRQQAAPVVNCAAALERLDNDHSLFLELVGFFWNDAPVLLHRIDTAISTGNAGELALAAHTLKGLASNFNAQRATELAGELEQMGRSLTFTGAEAASTALNHEVEQVKQALVEFCSQLSSDSDAGSSNSNSGDSTIAVSDVGRPR